MGGEERRRASSGSPWEPVIGFSRAVRVGDRILVAGTGPVWPDGTCPPDAEVQAARCLEIIGRALDDLGAGLGDVVRTRLLLADAAHAEAVGRAHAAAFAGAPPAATMVVVGLLDPRWAVEIEAEAVLPAVHRRPLHHLASLLAPPARLTARLRPLVSPARRRGHLAARSLRSPGGEERHEVEPGGDDRRDAQH